MADADACAGCGCRASAGHDHAGFFRDDTGRVARVGAAAGGRELRPEAQLDRACHFYAGEKRIFANADRAAPKWFDSAPQRIYPLKRLKTSESRISGVECRASLDAQRRKMRVGCEVRRCT